VRVGKETMNLLIGGEAGQGLLTIAQILTKTLVRSGYYIVVNQSYQSRIRGGHNTFAIRVSNREIIAPQEKIDLLIALDQDTVRIHLPEMTEDGRIVVDAKFDLSGERFIKIPYNELADQLHANIAALGVIGSLLGLDAGVMIQAVDDYFGAKKPEVAQQNRQTMTDTEKWLATYNLPSSLKLTPIPNPPPRLMINGNEALALGALSAGVKFCAFYPMTPATSIPLTLIEAGKRMGLIVEQAEDEIAAVNMAIGASYAGAPSMVATSGGGFALMVEGVSLAAMTETPIFIVVGQRPGPATGLPTRTEQSDLEFVLHSGHGEFPRAIFAPGTVEECFHLARRALELAEASQGPVFLLTDQFMADSYRAVPPFELEGLSAVSAGSPAAEAPLPYRRYALTASGKSPRLLPGMGPHLVVADSDEHTEDGHLTEDLAVRVQMVDKRLRKLQDLLAAVVPPEYHGDENPELLLVTWGSSRGSVLETAESLKAEGKRVAALCFSQVWPLAPAQFLNSLQGAGQVIAVEGNATGQLARLIRRETGFFIDQVIGRYDGLPVTPEFIRRELSRGAR